MEGEQKTPGRGRSRRQTGERKQAEKKERRIKILAAAGAAVLLLGGIGFGAYIHVARKYETVFSPIRLSTKSTYQAKPWRRSRKKFLPALRHIS